MQREKESATKEVTTLSGSLREREKSERELDQKLKLLQQDVQLQQKQMR